MGFATTLIPLFTVVASLFPQISAAPQNFVVPWSDKQFGPDGPWQAVNIQVGGYTTDRILGVQNVSALSVYPGGMWHSMTFSASVCKGFSTTTCGTGGFWEPDPGDDRQIPIQWPADWVDDSFGIRVNNAERIVLGLTINKTTVWNSTLASADSGNITYPSGRIGPVTLGSLSLGAEDVAQRFTLNGPDDAIVAPVFSGELFERGIIPSYSYGLHIGSAAFNYPGSLVFGGYNRGRVIEPIASYSNYSGVDLLDISIGVESGNSPFDFVSKDKLLSTGRTKAFPNSLSPYIALPRQTCDNLAGVLPIVFDKVLKYYLWNTSDPNFEIVVTSGAYLGFSFPQSPDSQENVTIKVPFALLNLTLDTPIVSPPVQYFPCTPYDTSTPVLGRAFLQAAFIGRNWQGNTSWIAQAPGPGLKQGTLGQERRQGLGEENVDIAEQAIAIGGYTGSDLFNKSWEGQWSLQESLKGGGMVSSQSDDNGSNGGLSTGAKAGIGVGVALGVIALLAALFFVRKAWARKRAAPGYHQADESSESHSMGEISNNDKPLAELSQGPNHLAAELPHHQQYSELPYTQQSPVELGDTTVGDRQR